jgi:hypothetical protein
MHLSRLRRVVLIALVISTWLVLAACAPITIQIGVPSLTPTSNATPTATLTPTFSPTATVITDTPSPTSVPAAANTVPPAITVIVQPPQPPPQQQPTHPAAPSKPSDLKADGTGTTIAFSWTDNSTNELGFRIYQVGEVAPVITLPAHTATGGMTYNWPGRPCNFSASFYIRSYNDNGESSSSNSDGGVTIPCTPTNFLANSSGNTINFNWAVATPHNESGFRIYQQGVQAPVATRGPNLGSGGTFFAWSGLACNLVGTYFVRAFNSAGESPDSNLIQTETYPCPPNGLTITNVTKTAVDYKWTDNSTNETGFHVYRDDALYTTLPAHPGTGAVTSDAFQPCDQNFPVTHVYSVRAFNYAGESLTSEHVGATTPRCF